MHMFAVQAKRWERKRERCEGFVMISSPSCCVSIACLKPVPCFCLNEKKKMKKTKHPLHHKCECECATGRRVSLFSPSALFRHAVPFPPVLVITCISLSFCTETYFSILLHTHTKILIIITLRCRFLIKRRRRKKERTRSLISLYSQHLTDDHDDEDAHSNFTESRDNCRELRCH